MSEINLDELRAELNDFARPENKVGCTALEEQIIAGFRETRRFVAEQGGIAQHGGGRQVFERLYAVRLDRMRDMEECRALLRPLDSGNLLSGESVAADGVDSEMDDEALLAELRDTDAAEITTLRHVRTSSEKRAAEEIANRTQCTDFELFKPLFERVQRELKTGVRHTLPVHKSG